MATEIDIHCRSQPSELLQQQQHEQNNFDDEFTTGCQMTSTPMTSRSTVDREDSPAAVATPASSSSSPRLSWEETFQNLSRDLQMICGSNGSVDEASSPNGDCTDSVQKTLPSPVSSTASVGNNSYHNCAARAQQSNAAVGTSSSSSACLTGGATGLSRPMKARGHHGSGDGVPTSPLSRSPICHPLLGGCGGGGARSSFPFPFMPATAAGRLPPQVGVSPVPAVTLPTRSGWRPIRVHHEETTDRLRQSLTKICMQNSSNSSSASPSPSSSTSGGLQQETPSCNSGSSAQADVSTVQRRSGDSSAAAAGSAKSRQLRMKESLKSGIKVRLDLVEAGCDPDYVIVVVRTVRPDASGDGAGVSTNDGSEAGGNVDRVLTIWNAAAASTPDADGRHTPTAPLASVTLPKQTRISALTCYVSEARTLYVRERAKDAMYSVVDPPESDVYLPVLREDESQLTVAITLHVPDQFHFEDLTVRTIDDRLMVKGRRGTYLPDTAGDESLSSAMNGYAASGSFVMMLALPDGTYSRTVRAALSPKEHQLVVSAMRAPASRRMTCAF